ncbi:hypothetical protein GQ602_003337 [Ophiocordyceps camponoti-floridani]|uniref:Uncharacterized protein n=1 Tax=Ophiocordyceps camponoti-floridani TaxID=2030778 RepID=A0A8H4Q807_9HYPO|nr:hypothetical protein GQ602_003337 [Ophiocordyceps camponoti-floridani]
MELRTSAACLPVPRVYPGFLLVCEPEPLAVRTRIRGGLLALYPCEAVGWRVRHGSIRTAKGDFNHDDIDRQSIRVLSNRPPPKLPVSNSSANTAQPFPILRRLPQLNRLELRNGLTDIITADDAHRIRQRVHRLQLNKRDEHLAILREGGAPAMTMACASDAVVVLGCVFDYVLEAEDCAR